MPRETSPAFQFYPQDFLSDDKVALMSPAARGCYITLLCHCWLHHTIPADLPSISKLAGADARSFPQIWRSIKSCFRVTEGGLQNPRIELERRKQAIFRENKRKAGQAGGKQTQSRRKADHQAESTSSSLSLSLSSSSSLTTNNKLTSKRKAAPSAQTPSRNGHEKREEDKNVRVITKIAHEVLRVNGHQADADAIDAIKTLCAKRHIAYDSETVRKALNSAEAQSA